MGGDPLFFILKMRKLLFFLSVLLLISSCSDSKNELLLFNTTYFKVLDKEIVTDVNYLVEKNYRTYFKNNTIQIPLFRYIERNDYKIFIGIPVNTSIKELANYKILDSDSSRTDFLSDSLNYSFKKYDVNNTFISEYCANVSNNIIYILSVTNKKEISDTLFTVKSLSQRIINKN